jgi:hypothetical protein
MNVAERFADEVRRERESERKATKTRGADDVRRRTAPGLVYRTTVTDQPEPKTETVTPPKVAPNETQVWWQWTNNRLAAQKSAIEHDIKAHFNMYDEVVGTALGMKAREVREDFERELNVVKRELEQAQSKIAAQVELEREREALRARAIEADRTEREGLRRDITLLREQIGLERGLRTLHDEVAAAHSEIPKLPAIVSQLQAETTIARADADKKIATLERELNATKGRLRKARVEQSITSYKLAEPRAQNYPSRFVQIVVPFPPGGSADPVARM